MDGGAARPHNRRAMDRLILIDSAIRLLAIGQLMLMALVIGRGSAPRPIRLSIAALLLCACAYLVISTPIALDSGSVLLRVTALAAQATPLMLWVFAHLVFERPLRPGLVAGGVAILFSCWLGFLLSGHLPNGYGLVLSTVQRSTMLLMTAHAVLIAVRERGDDLVEKRRRLRVGFVVVVGLLAVMVIVVEMMFGFRLTRASITLPQALAILVATMAMGAALLQSDPDILFDPTVDRRPPAGPTLSPSEHVLRQKLDAAMASGIHRESGMSIGVLADRLGTPEHRLRALINGRLGYRNFSAFLNHHRVAEAKAMLADPAHVDLPILTIAMDLGYGSLAPFNRAFREDTGRAPSDFRRAAIVRN